MDFTCILLHQSFCHLCDNCQMIETRVNVRMLLLGILIAIVLVQPVAARDDLPPLMTDGRFSGFDARAFVSSRHPLLTSSAEVISHWAAYYRVNPILLAHAIELGHAGTAPTGEAIKGLAASLARMDSDRLESSGDSPDNRRQLAERLGQALTLTSESAEQLIDQTMADVAAAGLSLPLAVVNGLPPAFDLPFARPQKWQFNGVHTWTGDNDGSPMSSLDFARTFSLKWGDNTSSDWVSASHDGEVTVFSSCFVSVQHDSGWGTRYYHLDNLQVVNGQRVLAGDPIGNYANELDQALCSGGHSNLPHVHFALLKDGQYVSLQDIELSGYAVHPGTSSYDQARDRMWLEKRGIRYYTFNLPVGTEEGDNAIDYRYNGMWYSPVSNGHGLNVEITEFPGEEASRQSVFIVVYTYDDSGLANFYVGNTDFKRWRSDQAMLIDMLQTAGGDFTNLAAIDFNEPDDVKPAGQAEIGFLDCNNAVIRLDLDERSSGQPTEHFIELVKLIGVPEHVCEAAPLALP